MPLTLSAVSSNSVRRGALLLFSLCFSRTSTAQQELSPDSSGSASDSASLVVPGESFAQVAPVATATHPVVHFTSVGTALPPVSLERMLGPALQSSFDLRFSSSKHFALEDLFQVRTGSPARIHVWVVTTEVRKARIYFANRDGTRYLVRDLECSDPLDEMDREAIAQAIEWSLQALAEGTAGMTRKEAEAMLSEASEKAPPAVEPKTLATVTTWRRKSSGWLPEVALLHEWTPVSGELPAAQGPRLRVGVDRLSDRRQFGVSAGVHYQYPQRHAQDGVAIELQAVGVRADVRYLATDLFTGSAIGVRLGVGLDTVFASAEALDWLRFEAEENTRYFIPVLAGGFIWQVYAESSVRLEVGLGVQIDLASFQYDVATVDGTFALVTPWPVRPSLSIGIALF